MTLFHTFFHEDCPVCTLCLCLENVLLECLAHVSKETIASCHCQAPAAAAALVWPDNTSRGQAHRLPHNDNPSSYHFHRKYVKSLDRQVCPGSAGTTLPTDTHTRTHMHSRTHAHAHTNNPPNHTHSHTNKNTHRHTQKNTHIHTQTHTRTRTQTQTQTHKTTHIPTRTHTHTHKNTQAKKHIHTPPPDRQVNHGY